MEDRWNALRREIPPGSALGEYLDRIEHDFDHPDPLFEKYYAPIVREEEAAGGVRPFLSVITRTQGRRMEMLREVLLCLAGQSDMDFELVLILHRAGDTAESVRRMVGEFPAHLRDRVRILTLEEGNRTAPLNYGFAHARGEYAAILDDDDLVFDNWVECFHRTAKKYPGRIVHAYCLSQDWETFRGPEGAEFVRSVSAPRAAFCVDFDLMRQMRENCCPLMSLAFPLWYFRRMGLCFDESLTTTEDWDYLMRTAFIAGVTDVSLPTSLYKQWKNAENSHSLHQEAEWEKNYAVIEDKFMNLPLLIPAGSKASLMRESMEHIDTGRGENGVQMLTDSFLYPDCGEGFLQGGLIKGVTACSGELFDAVFSGLEGASAGWRRVRFDPMEGGGIILHSITAVIRYADGGAQVSSLEDCVHNGYASEGEIYFAEPDPWLIWDVDPSRRITSVRIIGKSRRDLTGDLVRAIRTAKPWEEIQLFYAAGAPAYTEEQSLKKTVQQGVFEAVFDLPALEGGVFLRVDPGEDAGLWLKGFAAEYSEGDVWTEVKAEEIAVNGLRFGSDLLFPERDPQLHFHIPAAARVRIYGVLDRMSDREKALAERLAVRRDPGEA
ncbi:MAG: glycosyltransferase [Lachnospiraceae bacterium]|nr:glycosyltransferase [Lachnospiraceae bacterium]